MSDADGGGEIPLMGGFANMGSVVRVGDTVRRPATPQSAGVHAFLRHLGGAGLPVPEPLGFDDQGREILSYLEGDVATSPYPSWMVDADLLLSVASTQRRLHEAAADFTTPAGVPWASTAGDYFPETATGGLMCHNDLGVVNVVVRDAAVVGIIDFDYAKPVDRLFDIAVALRHWVPFAPPDRRPTVAAELDVALRFHAFCDVHELNTDERHRVADLIRAFIRQAQKNVVALAAGGHVGMQHLVDNGYVETIAATVRWLDQVLPML